MPRPETQALPSRPEGYAREVRGPVEWIFPSTATSIARELQETRRGAWSRVTTDLGGRIDPELSIRIAKNPEEMRELAPTRAPPPPYAVGVAYPARGLILLTLSAPDTWERPDLDKVLTHELSHIALYRSARGHALPHWFIEGVATYQAGEASLARFQTLWTAVVAGNVLPLDQVDGRFPHRPHEVNIAYAQSANLVAYMRKDDGDARHFRMLLRHVREGESFEEAVQQAYGVSLASIERHWREGLDSRLTPLPLLLGASGGIWFIAVLLLMLAYVVQRRRTKKKLDRWEREEAATLVEVQSPPPPPSDEQEGRVLLLVPGDPPQGRESGIPTVEVDGKDHTLH